MAATLEFLKDQYRHCKPILVLGAAAALLRARRAFRDAADGRRRSGPDASAGIERRGRDAFIAALAEHRHFERETDPPLV